MAICPALCSSNSQKLSKTHSQSFVRYIFLKILCDLFFQEVLSTSSNELKDFLEIVQVNAPKVGTVILQKYLQKRRPNNPSQPKPMPAASIVPSVGTDHTTVFFQKIKDLHFVRIFPDPLKQHLRLKR